MSIVIGNDKDAGFVDFRDLGGWWVLDPPLAQMNTPEATILIQTSLIPRHAPVMPVCLTGHVPILLQLTERGGWGVLGVDGVVGDGHPDYASSYGLFTIDTKQCGKQRRRNAN